MVDYGRLFIAFLGVLLTLLALYVQAVFLALSTEGGPLPPGGVLGIGAICGGAVACLAFLVGLFAGVRFALGIAGWVLVVHLVLYGLLIAALAPTPVESWAVSVLNPYPIPLGVALVIVAVGLVVSLIRSARPPAKSRPAA